MRSMPAAELGFRLHALGIAARTTHHVPLRAQHGQRRTKFVCGIGGEAALASQHGLDARKEAVHRADQGLELGRCPASGTG